MGDKLREKAPRIFYVNWFRKNAEGKFIWPGFGENSRVLKWMCERVEGRAGAKETPIGLLPRDGDLDTSGLTIKKEDMAELLKVDVDAWKAEVPGIKKHFAQFGARLPERMNNELEALKSRLGNRLV